MTLLQKLLHKLNGLHYSQEYLCLAKEQFTEPLSVYLVIDGLIRKDISGNHLFVGYHPVIFALPTYDDPDLHKHSCVTIIFSEKLLSLHTTLSARDHIALLSLRKISELTAGTGTIYLYEGIEGRHNFLSSFHQFIIDLNNRLHNKKAGNVFLKGNLYRQVQIAYSIPRTISLITTSIASLFNLFPTDLHGQITNDYYIISLRSGGLACSQVEEAKQLVITNVHCNVYKQVYGLGKNHMQPLKPKENFSFSEETSANLNLPLPNDAIGYKELKLQHTFSYGIHKLLVFRILFSEDDQIPYTLAHLHNCYATWRYKQGLGSNYLLR